MLTRLLTLLAMLAAMLAVIGPPAQAATASGGPCTITPIGLIHDRWDLLDGKDGPLGCATGPEQDVPGRNGKRQDFEHGQIAWSPDQGKDLTVAAYQLGKSAVVEFGPANPFSYDHFLVRWDRDGQNLGQESARFVTPTTGSHRVNPDKSGDYVFVVEGCDKPRYGSSKCRQGWTIPVTAHVDLSGSTHDGISPKCFIGAWEGEIYGKWYSMGHELGPLGCAVAAAEDVPGRHGKRQRFEHGEIVWSPDQGAQMTVAAYLLGNRVSVDWGPTTPFTYDFFQIRYDKDGANLGQDELKARLMSPSDGDLGRWTRRLQGMGEYSFVVQGCDAGGFLGGATCRQGWTIPVHVTLQAQPGQAACTQQAGGLIGERWQELRGSAGLLSCPTGPEQDVSGRRGKRQDYQHGQIAWSPDQGDKMVVAAYQQEGQAVFEWGPSQPRFDYDVFIVRWDSNGRNLGQREIKGSRTSGKIRVGLPPNWGPITFVVEGCDTGIGGSTCRQGWTIPVGFTPTSFSEDVDISAMSATDPATALATHDNRTKAVVEQLACQKIVDLDGTQPGEDEAATMVTRMERVQLEGNADACAGELPNRLLVNEILRDMPTKPVGTESDDCPVEPKTLGDYDTFLKGLLYIAYRDRWLLDNDVWQKITHELLTMNGPHRVSEEGKVICAFVSPESENHILLIESARYLTNQIFFAETQDAIWDNHVNGMDVYLLRFLQTISKHDFLEFNARPYQRYSLNALLNLYDFAEEPRMRAAARILLDYATTKFAVSSNKLRRAGPFRRLAANTDAANGSYYSGGSDPQTGFFLLYTGLSEFTDGKLPGHWRIEASIAGLSKYRPPRAAYELAMNKGTPYEERFYHGDRPKIHPDADRAEGGVEIYSSSPSFLISAGGVFLNSGYRMDEFTGYRHRGNGQATTLMPTAANLNFADLIRFNGGLRPGHTPPDRDVVNTCVAGGFACGLQGVVPERWQRCLGPESDGQWLLLDSDKCGGLGFHVAIQINKNGVQPGVYENAGFFYALEKSKMPFSTFATKIKELNTGIPRNLDVTTPYTFHAPDDHTYRFQLHRFGDKYLNRILEIDGVKQPDSLTVWPLADGEFLRSPGHDGLIKIFRPGCANPLTLDFRDMVRPAVTDPATPDPSPICPAI
ncbi:LGFP repeat-containing protein [Nonomuraea sediminis]|uniref:LGFP repeat-containing protein n=1 Tax=Nonomuraea sediminis TaxID=2835864 RepID=UPI001BDC641B|nr:hypothetical protein [Nonomuraea sediminis]